MWPNLRASAHVRFLPLRLTRVNTLIDNECYSDLRLLGRRGNAGMCSGSYKSKSHNATTTNARLSWCNSIRTDTACNRNLMVWPNRTRRKQFSFCWTIFFRLEITVMLVTVQRVIIHNLFAFRLTSCTLSCQFRAPDVLLNSAYSTVGPSLLPWVSFAAGFHSRITAFSFVTDVTRPNRRLLSHN